MEPPETHGALANPQMLIRSIRVTKLESSDESRVWQPPYAPLQTKQSIPGGCAVTSDSATVEPERPNNSNVHDEDVAVDGLLS